MGLQLTISDNDTTGRELTTRGYNVYTNEDRKQAAVLYALHGNVQEIARITGFPDKTLYGWLKSDWWPRVYEEARREYAELIEARLSTIVERATLQLVDRIENGDEILTKTGIRRIRLKARDLSNIIDKSIDKIRVLQNKPNRVTVEAKFDATKLERQFNEFAVRHRDAVVVEQ